MRTSSQRTPVAKLRDIIGQKTPEFAEMVGLSLSAVEKLESGRLKISEAVAQKISFETGVDARWLLDGDPHFPPFMDIAVREYLSPRRKKDHKDFAEASYSKKVFDRVRAMRLAKEFPEGEHTREEQIICLLFRLLFFYSSARSNGEEVMALYRLHNIEGDLAEEFGLSLDEPAFELASKATGCLQTLVNRLKRDQNDLRGLAFGPGKAEPIKFLQLRHRMAKAIRAIYGSRNGDLMVKRKTRSTPTRKKPAQLMAATTPQRPAH
jgi:transcriptional regulator with XRE-family HTH domain